MVGEQALRCGKIRRWRDPATAGRLGAEVVSARAAGSGTDGEERRRKRGEFLEIGRLEMRAVVCFERFRMDSNNCIGRLAVFVEAMTAKAGRAGARAVQAGPGKLVEGQRRRNARRVGEGSGAWASIDGTLLGTLSQSNGFVKD